jgi:hypothetical protein
VDVCPAFSGMGGRKVIRSSAFGAESSLGTSRVLTGAANQKKPRIAEASRDRKTRRVQELKRQWMWNRWKRAVIPCVEQGHTLEPNVAQP